MLFRSQWTCPESVVAQSIIVVTKKKIHHNVCFIVILSTYQSYELMKTEDIPDMQNSKFSTTVVKDVAQNILSFIKANAAKEGHTYWLYKGRTAMVIKSHK